MCTLCTYQFTFITTKRWPLFIDGELPAGFLFKERAMYIVLLQKYRCVLRHRTEHGSSAAQIACIWQDILWHCSNRYRGKINAIFIFFPADYVQIIKYSAIIIIIINKSSHFPNHFCFILLFQWTQISTTNFSSSGSAKTWSSPYNRPQKARGVEELQLYSFFKLCLRLGGQRHAPAASRLGKTW